MSDWVECSSQAQVDAAVAAGDWPVVRRGTVRAFGSATVHACGSATVHACGSATVRAFGSATVHACGSATVHACGSATVHAFGSATVHACGSATVHACGSATVRATPHVAIHRHGTTPKVTGGVLVQVPEIRTPDEFVAYYGLKPSRGTVTLYKLVDDEFVSAHGTSYRPGEKPVAADWQPTDACGNGLHFSPRPFMADRYSSGSRYVACRVKVADIVVITGMVGADKCKARACMVLFECDADGKRIGAA
ncbi:MAG: DUF7666 domain-containing protein [Acidiferrobacteraceae bacterium]